MKARLMASVVNPGNTGPDFVLSEGRSAASTAPALRDKGTDLASPFFVNGR
jgi:hypothetical protein